MFFKLGGFSFKNRYQGERILCFFLFLLSSSVLNVPDICAEELQKDEVWKTRIEASYVKTSGNTDIQSFAGKFEIKQEGLLNRYFFSGNFLFARDESRETSNKLSSEARWERVFSKRTFGLLSGGYLIDKFSGYEYRLFGGPGFGYDFIKTQYHALKWLLSFHYYHDEFSKGEKKSDRYISGKTIGKYEWKIQENLKIKEKIEYTVSFENTDKYFIDSDTALEVKVNRFLSFGISYLFNYQNKLPSKDIERIDTTFLTTLIVDF